MVYLIHFDRRISDRHTTQHYTGYCADGRLSERLAEHRAGTGARLTQVANERGIGFEVVRVWDGGRDTERQIKRRHEGPGCAHRMAERARNFILNSNIISIDIRDNLHIIQGETKQNEVTR